MARFASLWIGPMTRLERLSLNSFVKNGHEHHLYLYDMKNSIGIPKEVIVHDANEIIKEKDIFQDIHYNHYFQFADKFRLNLVKKYDYIWTDLDTICLSPDWKWNEMFLCKMELRSGQYDGEDIINNSLFYIKPNHPMLAEMVEIANEFDYKKSTDAFILSPHLFTSMFLKKQENYKYIEKYIQPFYVTYPIHYMDIWKIYHKEHLSLCESLSRRSFSIHLWRNTLFFSNEDGHEDSLLNTMPEKDSYLYNLYQKYLPFSSRQDWQNL